MVWINHDITQVVCKNHKCCKMCEHKAIIYHTLKQVGINITEEKKKKLFERTEEWNEDNGFADWDILHQKELKTISKHAIPVPRFYQTLNENINSTEFKQEQQINDIYYNRNRDIPQSVEPILFEKECINCNHKWEKNDLKPINHRSIFYTAYRTHEIQIHQYHCPECNNIIQYDGWHDDILNINNKKLYDHNILDEWKLHKHKDGASMHAYCTIKQALYYSNQSKEKFVSDNTFAMVYNAYFKLQQFWKTLFCSGCKEQQRALPRFWSGML